MLDLEDIQSYDELHGTQNYRAIVEGIEALAARDFSGEGRKVQLDDGVPARRIVLGRFLVYYEQRPAGMWVLRIHHSARRPIERK